MDIQCLIINRFELTITSCEWSKFESIPIFILICFLSDKSNLPWYNYLTTDIPRVQKPASVNPPPLVATNLDESFQKRMTVAAASQPDPVNTNAPGNYQTPPSNYDSRPQLRSAMRNSRYQWKMKIVRNIRCQLLINHVWELRHLLLSHILKVRFTIIPSREWKFKRVALNLFYLITACLISAAWCWIFFFVFLRSLAM